MAVPCPCGGVACTVSSIMYSATTRKSWVQCKCCMRYTTRFDEEADILFPGIPNGSINSLPSIGQRLKLRNAGILRKAFAKQHLENQLELPLDSAL